MRNLALVAALSLGVALTACSPRPDPGKPVAGHGLAALTGEVSYRQRIALPPDARLNVRIEDVSLMDAPSVTIAETSVATNGRQVPLAFTLNYDPMKIIPGRRYAVRADIRAADGRLLWVTDTHIALPSAGPSAGAPGITIMLAQVAGADGEETPPMARPRLEGTDWLAIGNEPGWRVEVNEGERLTYDGDYGAVRIMTPAPPAAMADDGTRSWTIRTDAHRLTLELAPIACQDDMAGTPYPLTARLVVDGKALRGCARPAH